MIIECTSCHAKYQYDEDRFERKPSKKIKCAKCQTIFEIINPAYAKADDSTASRHDETNIARPKRTQQDTTEQKPIPHHATGKVTSSEMKLPEGKRLSLAIIDGPDAGTVLRIEKPRVTIGRSGADITINDTEASRQHAAVEIHDTAYVLQDLGSTNGTLVDGRKISEPTDLQDKSEFQIGSTVLMLIVTDEA